MGSYCDGMQDIYIYTIMHLLRTSGIQSQKGRTFHITGD